MFSHTLKLLANFFCFVLFFISVICRHHVRFYECYIQVDQYNWMANCRELDLDVMVIFFYWCDSNQVACVCVCVCGCMCEDSSNRSLSSPSNVMVYICEYNTSIYSVQCVYINFVVRKKVIYFLFGRFRIDWNIAELKIHCESWNKKSGKSAVLV